jgi:hypothetical protein
LLVEHRPAVTRVAPRAAARRRREEEPGATPLRGRQRAVVSGQEPVPGRVPRDRGAQEGRGCAQDRDVVDEQIHVPGGVSLLGFFRKRLAEQFHVGVEPLQNGGLILQ